MAGESVMPKRKLPETHRYELPMRTSPSKSSLHKKTKLAKKCVCIPSGFEATSFPVIWNELRVANQLMDGFVVSRDNEEIPVHRAILAAVSSYFKALFTNTVAGKPYEKHSVTIDLPSSIIKLILDFAYTGQCKIANENVQDLLVAADKYDINGIVRKCCAFLLNGLTAENCLGVLRFAKHYFCVDLEKKGDRFIRNNFKDIIYCSPEFINLSADELCALMSHDELNVRNEELIFELIERWIAHDSVNRTCKFTQLSRCPRYGLMAYNFFRNKVLCSPLVLMNQQVQESLQAVTAYLAEEGDKSFKGLDLNLDVARPRIPSEILFAIGGWSAGSPTSFVETYDTRADRWFLSMSTDTIARAYHGICALGNVVYMIGGFDGTDHFNTVRCFDPVTRTWIERACMYHARCYVSVCVLDNLMYAMGGYNGRNRMQSVERYHPIQNQWELMAPMAHERSDGCAAALNGKIYIAGGFNGTEVLNTVEVYDPTSNQWTYVTSMRVPRSGVSLVAYRGELLALGGFDGISRLQSGESFDPTNGGNWKPIVDMFNPRSNFSSVVLDDLIFVIGGFNGSSTVASVECFDGDSLAWFEASPMNLNRSALGACVLTELPNNRDYSYLSKVEECHSGGSASPAADMMAGGETKRWPLQ